MTITEEQLAEWKAIAAAATPGPWRWADWSATFGTREDPDRMLVLEQHLRALGDPAPIVRERDDDSVFVLRAEYSDETAADKAFIAAARMAVPALIAEVEHLRERQQAHLAQIAKLSQTVPLESEVAEALNQRGALLAEVGTLRASLVTQLQVTVTARQAVADVVVQRNAAAARCATLEEHAEHAHRLLRMARSRLVCEAPGTFHTYCGEELGKMVDTRLAKYEALGATSARVDRAEPQPGDGIPDPGGIDWDGGPPPNCPELAAAVVDTQAVTTAITEQRVAEQIADWLETGAAAMAAAAVDGADVTREIASDIRSGAWKAGR